jgi:hypothetical protein
VCERRVFNHSSVEGGLVGSLCSEDFLLLKIGEIEVFEYWGGHMIMMDHVVIPVLLE